MEIFVLVIYQVDLGNELVLLECIMHIKKPSIYIKFDLVGINNRKLKSLNDLQLISGTPTFSHLRAEC